MKLRVFLAGGALAFAIAAAPGFGQTCIALVQPAFRNLDFSEGASGERPPGWGPTDPACYQPPHEPDPVEIVASRLCFTGQHCAVVRSAPPPEVPGEDEVMRYISLLRAAHGSKRVGLFQNVDVTLYRGKILTFRAAVRAEVSAGSEARLFVRIHRENGTTIFFDDMGRFPVRSSAWHFYEIPAPIDRDASDVEFGMVLIGQGEAWIDHITMDFTDPGK
jgi:hypothetical protein